MTTTAGGIVFAFPNVCLTPPPAIGVPIPYPSIGQLTKAAPASSNVKAGGSPVVTKKCQIASTTGDAAGTLGGVKSGQLPGGKVEFTSASRTVFANGSGVVRQFDTTSQNNGNAKGIVLGGLPSVLVGD